MRRVTKPVVSLLTPVSPTAYQSIVPRHLLLLLSVNTMNNISYRVRMRCRIVCHLTSGGGTVSKISFVTEVTQEVVYTSEEPSLVMTYDRQLSVHSVWNLREPKPKVHCTICEVGRSVG